MRGLLLMAMTAGMLALLPLTAGAMPRHDGVAVRSHVERADYYWHRHHWHHRHWHHGRWHYWD